MLRLLTPGLAVAAALAISACGGGGSNSDTAGSASSADTVSVHDVSGVGNVLVDEAGKPIYTSDLEASGKIVCSTGCTSFWKPVTASGKPTAGSGTGKLGVIKRPDGTMQVTANGRPLYTFSEDSPGKSTGNGFTDDFSGHHFTWHVVKSGGTASSGGAQSTPSYGGSSGGGY